MCCCPKPNKNGEPGYSWDGKSVGTRAPNGPDVLEAETMVFDEPGRCRPLINGSGAIDYHSHHFRVVGARFDHFALLVRHGGGDERIELHTTDRIPDLLALLPDSDARYLLMHALYNAHSEAADAARSSEAHKWRAAAADKRIKTRRYPKRGTTKVWIEEGPRVHDVTAG